MLSGSIWVFKTGRTKKVMERVGLNESANVKQYGY
jgi:hypothetical protein